MDSQKGFLLVLVTLFLSLAAMMLLPFLGYILAAMLLAFVLMPLQDRIKIYIGDQLSAFTLIFLSIVIVAVPFALIFGAVAPDAQEAITSVNSTNIVDMGEIEGLVLEHTGREVDVEAQIQGTLDTFVDTTIGSASRVVNIVANIGIGLSVMFFILYYLLKDGKDFKAYIKEIVPLPSNIIEQLETKTYVGT
ncbi:MAG: AI-2E family transporter, partial [Candidatus Nanohaloarchaea archaeon]